MSETGRADIASSLEVSDDGVIRVVWGDGHRSEYDPKYLRVSCACAECIEEWSRRQLLDPVTVPADIRAEDYLMVGRYAVQFLWSDGHYTGIYPFKMLRALCRCDECRGSQRDVTGGVCVAFRASRPCRYGRVWYLPGSSRRCCGPPRGRRARRLAPTAR